MMNFPKVLRSASAVLASAALLGSAIAVATPAAVLAQTPSHGYCLYEGGSSTVEPGLTAAITDFQNANPGCNLRIGKEGSGTGISGLVGGYDGVNDLTFNTYDVAASSSALKADTSGVNKSVAQRSSTTATVSAPGFVGGQETSVAQQFQIGWDAYVFFVSSDSTMNWLTGGASSTTGVANNGITDVQVKAIWTGLPGADRSPDPAGVFQCYYWDDAACGFGSVATGHHDVIIPRSRELDSGTRRDILKVYALTMGHAVNPDGSNYSVYEENRQAATGLPRLQASVDMAAAVAHQNNQIAYSSVANVGYPGTLALTHQGKAGGPLGKGSDTAFVQPTKTTIQNQSYPSIRKLFLVLPKFIASGNDMVTVGSWNGVNGNNPISAIMDPHLVKAEAFVNFMASQTGQLDLSNGKLVPFQNYVPIPPADVNLDGYISLPDIGQITGHWGLSNTALPGWVRPDITNDGYVTLPDIGQITGNWGKPGYTGGQ